MLLVVPNTSADLYGIRLARWARTSALAPLVCALIGCGDDGGEQPVTRREPDDNALTPDASMGDDDRQSDANAPSAPAQTSHDVTADMTGSTTDVTQVPATEPPTTSTTTTDDATTPPDTTTTDAASAAPTDGWVPIGSHPLTNASNCEENLFAPDDGSCAYRVRCGEREPEFWSNCTPQENGQWECSCLEYRLGRSADYTIVGADQQTVCQSGLAYCTGNPPDPNHLDCERQTPTGSSTSCEQEATCFHVLSLANGAVGRRPFGGPSTTCTGNGQHMLCECGEGSGGLLVVTGESSPRACSVASEVCDGTWAASASHECQPPEVSIDDIFCTSASWCGYRAELEGGVEVLVDATQRSSNCQVYGNDASCGCGGSSGSSAFLTFSEDTVLDACQVADTLCVGHEPLQLAGGASCNVASSASSGQSCTASADCSRPGSLDETLASARAKIRVDCERAGDSTDWTCTCASGSNTSDQFHATGSDGVVACTKAAQSCGELAEQLEVRETGAAQFGFGTQL